MNPKRLRDSDPRHAERSRGLAELTARSGQLIEQIWPDEGNKERLKRIEYATALHEKWGSKAVGIILSSWSASRANASVVALLLCSLVQAAAQRGDEGTAYRAASEAQNMMRLVEHIELKRSVERTLAALIHSATVELVPAAKARQAAKRQRSEAGRASGRARRDEGKRKIVIAQANRLLMDRAIEQRSLAGMVAKAADVSASYSRRVLQEATILQRRKKRA